MKSLKQSEKGVFAVAYTMVIVLTLFVISAALLTSVGTNTRSATISLLSTQAYYVAEAGAEWALKMLADSSTWRTGVTGMSVGNGTVNVVVDDSSTITALADSIRITATSTLDDLNKTIQVYLLSLKPWPYVAFADDAAEFDSGTITGNVHANDEVELNSATVTGTVTTGGNKSLPVIDWAYYQTQATNQGQYVSGNKDFENETITGIWFVTGDVKFEEECNLTGTVVSRQKITIDDDEDDGNFQTGSPNLPLFVAKDEIKCKKSTLLTGFIYAGDEFESGSHNAVNVQGAIIAGEKIDLENSATLIYDKNYSSNILGMDWGTIQAVKWVVN